MEFQQMQFGSVAFVLVEAILRELGAKVTHHPVARYLGDHARCSDAQTDAVAVNNRSLRKWKRNNGQPVNQDVVRRVDECCDRQAHRPMARAQNVDAINLAGIDTANRPSDFGIEDQIRINFLAQFRRKLFGIVQATVTKFFRKNYCSGHNRASQRPTASFINPSNTRDTGGAQFFLVTKSASPVHFRDLTTRRFNDLTNSLNHSTTKSLNGVSFAHSRRFLTLAGAKII
jgi:hypothetical protein